MPYDYSVQYSKRENAGENELAEVPLFFFRARSTIFPQLEDEIAVSSKRLMLET